MSLDTGDDCCANCGAELDEPRYHPDFPSVLICDSDCRREYDDHEEYSDE